MPQRDSDPLSRISSAYYRNRAEEQMVKSEAARDPLCRATWRAMAEQYQKMAKAEDEWQAHMAETYLQEKRPQEEIFELTAAYLDKHVAGWYEGALHRAIFKHRTPRERKAIIDTIAGIFGKSIEVVEADLNEKAALVRG